MSRRVNPTLSTFQDKLMTAYAFLHGKSVAELLKDGANKIIEPLNEKNRADLLRVYEKMSPAERQNPHK